MKKYLFTILLLVTLIPARAGADSSAGNLTQIIPPNKSFVTSEFISIVLATSESTADEIKIFVNDKKQPIRKKIVKSHYSCFDGVRLSFGINRIKIVSFKAGEKYEEINSQVFFKSDLSPNTAMAPPEFGRYVFHNDTREKTCTPCHQLDFSKVDAQKSAAEQSPCFSCHKKMLSTYKFVHGPAAVWSCLMCHDGKSRKVKLAVQKPEEKMCANCHENSWASKKYTHGPTAAGNCATCHNPHAADDPNFLRLSAGDLCAACHEDVLFRPHILSSFSFGGGHPVSRSPDPFNPGKDLTCASCHNPHASNSPIFLNTPEEPIAISAFCRSCHRM
jgi:predicted CXXCH cytochrome family protein